MTQLVEGQTLVPRETPYGPTEAREAWADALGQLVVVVKVLRSGRVRLNFPALGETTGEMDPLDVLAEYAPADASAGTYADHVLRAAVEAARVERVAGEGEERYWQRVAQACRRVEVEMFPPEPSAALVEVFVRAYEDDFDDIVAEDQAAAREDARRALRAVARATAGAS